jgi:hypothetical protein
LQDDHPCIRACVPRALSFCGIRVEKMSYFRLAGLADHFRTSVLIRSSVHSPKGTVFGLDEQVPLNAHLNAHQIDGYIAMPSRDFRVPATLPVKLMRRIRS